MNSVFTATFNPVACAAGSDSFFMTMFILLLRAFRGFILLGQLRLSSPFFGGVTGLPPASELQLFVVFPRLLRPQVSFV